jgi:hypothetical protein
MVLSYLSNLSDYFMHHPLTRVNSFLSFISSSFLDFRPSMSLFVVKRTDQLDHTLGPFLSEIKNVEVYRDHFDPCVA